MTSKPPPYQPLTSQDYPPPQSTWPPPQPTSPPPQELPQPQQQEPVVTTVQAQPIHVVVQTPAFRDYPVIITDSSGEQVLTVISHRSGLLTWIAVSIVFVLTLPFGLCFLAFIPLLMKDLKDVYHINPTDGTVVGIYKRLG